MAAISSKKKTDHQKTTTSNLNATQLTVFVLTLNMAFFYLCNNNDFAGLDIDQFLLFITMTR